MDCTGRLNLTAMRVVLIGSVQFPFNHLLTQSAPDSFLPDDSGLLPSLVGIAHVAIQLPVYGKVKLYFARRGNNIHYKKYG